jgi:2,3-bisphosphoglycerate-independent phosphoglycerate mutase
MQDFSAGHISTKEATQIINTLNNKLSNDSVHFYTGVGYRNICIIKGKFYNLQCTPPHDITGKDISRYFPRGEGEEIVKNIMNTLVNILQRNEINNKRIKNKQLPATQIWLWGQGYKPKLPDFYKKYGVKGSVIAAVDLIRGIAKLAGLDVINVKGATGFLDTNYEGKADAALKSLEDKDFVFIHVEAPDEAGHSGDLELKIKAIEDLDRKLLGRLLEKIGGDYRILVMPDHPTPIRIKTHTNKPVPFILFGKGVKSNAICEYSERKAKESNIFIEKGYKIIDRLLHREENRNSN